MGTDGVKAFIHILRQHNVIRIKANPMCGCKRLLTTQATAND